MRGEGFQVLRNADLSPGWIKRREAISRQIEMAALTLCLKVGIDTIKVEDIAASAGISRRTLYRYFNAVDDILTAAPRRALERIAKGIRERPAEEGILEAIVQGAYRWGPSAEEREIQVLGARLADTQPDAWFRIINRMRPSGYDVYKTVVAERLRASSVDDSLAPLIADVVVAVIKHAAVTYRENGDFAVQAKHLEGTFKAMSAIFAKATADSGPREAPK
jgi:AcrR family transcriptional regulator